MAFPSNYSAYDAITINHNYVGTGGTTNQDVWIPYSILSSQARTGMSNDAGDIRFTLDDATTQLPRQVITDSNGNTTGFRVLIPSLSDATDTVIRCWYNGTDAEPDAASSYGSQNAYDSDSAGYWLLSESPAVSVPQVIDQTANGYNATSYETMTSSNLTTGALYLGQSTHFDGVDDHYRMSSPVITKTSKVTLSVIVSVAAYPTSSMNYLSRILSLKTQQDATDMALFQGGGWDNSGLANQFSAASGKGYVGTSYAISPYTTNLNAWYHVVGTYDGSNNRLYVNGTLMATQSYGGDIDSANDNVQGLSMGGGYNVTASTLEYALNGNIQHARVDIHASAVRDQAWITTNYNNLFVANGFFSDVTNHDLSVGGTTTARKFPIICSSLIHSCRSF